MFLALLNEGSAVVLKLLLLVYVPGLIVGPDTVNVSDDGVVATVKVWLNAELATPAVFSVLVTLLILTLVPIERLCGSSEVNVEVVDPLS